MSRVEGAGQMPRARSRGRRLSLEGIVSATLKLIDEHGMGAASMRGVAAELGVEPMSLYSYVANRDELFDLVIERVVDELESDPEVEIVPTQGWRPYMAAMARGVRRYAINHPHAFPLVATRPSQAPWVNPPLRSLRWIESFLAGLRAESFTDDQVLFAYRTFNSFLLGYLLLETSAIAMRDPLPGDGSFTAGASSTEGVSTAKEGSSSGEAKADGDVDPPDADTPGGDAVSSATPVPGALSPTRSISERRALREAKESGDPSRVINPTGEVNAERYPTVHELSEGLAEDTFEREFTAALDGMLDRISLFLDTSDQ